MPGQCFLLLATVILIIHGVSASQPEAKQPIALKGHKDSIMALTFLGDGELLASASLDKTIKVWDTTNEKEIATLTGHNAGVASLASSRNGKLLASGDEKGILRVWDVETKKELHVLKGQNGDIVSLAFTPDGKILAAGARAYNQVAIWGEIRLWNPSTGKQIAVLDELETPAVSLAVSPNGKSLAACSSNGSVYLWELEGDFKSSLVGKNPVGASSVAFSPDGKLLVCGGGGGPFKSQIMFWDAGSRKEHHSFEEQHGPDPSHLAFLPDGKTLVVGGSDYNKLRDSKTRGAYLGLWDVATCQKRIELPGHLRAVLSIALNHSGDKVAAGGLDNVVRVWSLSGKKKDKE